jgi:hypothetical protein
MHESDIEKLFFEYGNLQKDFFVYKVPDQRKCVNGTYARNPMMPAGQPDLIVVHDTGVVSYVEVKTQTGKLSDNQKRFIDKLQGMKVMVFVCRTIAEFKQALNDIRNMSQNAQNALGLIQTPKDEIT